MAGSNANATLVAFGSIRAPRPRGRRGVALRQARAGASLAALPQGAGRCARVAVCPGGDFAVPACVCRAHRFTGGGQAAHNLDQPDAGGLGSPSPPAGGGAPCWKLMLYPPVLGSLSNLKLSTDRPKCPRRLFPMSLSFPIISSLSFSSLAVCSALMRARPALAVAFPGNSSRMSS